MVKTILAQWTKIRTKTHGLNPNFCCQIQTGTGHSRNWHGPDSNLAHWTRSLAWAKKQGFRVLFGIFFHFSFLLECKTYC